MADVTIKYKGETLATLDASGSRTIECGGRWVEGDIVVEYDKPESSGGSGGSGGSGIEKASGSKYFDADYESLTPYAIAHGLSQKPKVVYFWTGVTSPVAERQYIGSVWIENLAIGVSAGLVNLGATIMNSGSTVGTQSGLYQAKNAPDATNIYIYIASTSNKIPAGTTVYWEAIAW